MAGFSSGSSRRRSLGLTPALGGLVILFGLLGLAPSALTQAGGRISTVAGTGVCGFSGDGGLAVYAQLNSPATLAADIYGNLYIADLGNQVVRKVSPFGTITTIAGTGAPGFNGDNQAATNARLNAPAGVAVDPSGRYVYIGDNGNHRVRRVDLATQTISTVAGTGEPGYSGDGGLATQARLANPSALAIDAIGNLYIATPGTYNIRRVDPSGIISTFAGTGSYAYCGDGGPARQACFKSIMGLAIGRNGDVYIADMISFRVRRVDYNGTITTVAGDGHFEYPTAGPATQSSLKWPIGLALDAADNLYIADFASNMVVRVDPFGTLSIVSGTGTAGFNDGPALQAAFFGPSGISLDRFGKLYIADSRNCRVRSLSLP